MNCEASLRLSRNVYGGGRPRIGLELRFENVGDRAFNAFGLFNPASQTPRVVVLALYDRQKQYQGDVFFSMVVGRSGSPQAQKSDWVRLPPGGICGRILRDVAGVINPTNNSPLHGGPALRDLPDGRYAMQAIVLTTVRAERTWSVLEDMLSSPETRGKASEAELRKMVAILGRAHDTADARELFRSNPVWFTIDRSARSDEPTSIQRRRPTVSEAHVRASRERMAMFQERFGKRHMSVRRRGPVEAERSLDVEEWREPRQQPRFARVDTGTAAVEVEREEFGPDAPLRFRVLCRAHDETPPLFNPFFDRTLPPPARVLLFDEAHRYLGDVPLGGAAVGRPPASDAYRGFHHDELAGAFFKVPLRRASTDIAAVRTDGLELPAGTYFLQAVYLNRFTWSLPDAADATDRANRSWTSPKTNWEDFRSEAVPFQVTE